MHRTILVVDVEGFGDRRRTNHDQVVLRAGVYGALRRAFDVAKISWEDCHREDRGDGVLVLAPADLPKSHFVASLPRALVRELRRHNRRHSAEQRIRLRMAVHAGEVTFDDHGVTAAAINVAFRLIDAGPLKAALSGSSGVLAVIVSAWFFEEVVRHAPAAGPESYRQVPVSVKETTTIGWLRLPDDPHPPRDPERSVAPPRMVPRQLPPAPGVLVGRHRELAELTSIVDSQAESVGAVVICAIDGAGGIGKTTLALHWAHRNLHRFPDGQLHVNLHGFDADGPPTPPAVAVRGFLAALGVEPTGVPVDPQAQTGLYRSLVAGRRLLIMLDNARDSAQIEPLLPGSSTCTVLVTSRHRPARLALRGAHVLDLDVLTDDEARELLVERLGAECLRAEPVAAQQLLDFCAGLPLALAIVAARAGMHRTFPLRVLAEELRERSSRLDALDAGGDLAANLRAALSWSFDVVEPAAAAVFRLLGVAPGSDIGLPAAASMTGLPTVRARTLLRDLESAHLVQQHRPERYRMHDLIRIYAEERADRDLVPEVRETALRRLVDFYLHTAHAADRLLYPHRARMDPAALPDGCSLPHLADESAALDWFSEEYQHVLAVQRIAMSLGWLEPVWRLARVLDTYLYRRGLLRDGVDTSRLGAAAADLIGDVEVRALAHRQLGRAYTRHGEFAPAIMSLRRALVLIRKVDDPLGRAHAHHDLARAHSHCGEHRLALRHASLALELYRATGHHVGEAHALNARAHQLAELGNHPHAMRCSEAALSLHRTLDNVSGQVATLNTLGFIAQRAGSHVDAAGFYAQAFSLCRAHGNSYAEAEIAERLADARAAQGQYPHAVEALWSAHSLYTVQHRVSDAERVRHKLTVMSDSRPPISMGGTEAAW